MNAITDGVHVSPTEVDGMYEFMDHGLVRVLCVDEMLLAEEYGWEEAEGGGLIFGCGYLCG